MLARCCLYGVWHCHSWRKGESKKKKTLRSELHFLWAPISLSGMFDVKYSSANGKIKIYSYASLREQWECARARGVAIEGEGVREQKRERQRERFNIVLICMVSNETKKARWKIRSHTKNEVTTPQKFISFFIHFIRLHESIRAICLCPFLWLLFTRSFFRRLLQVPTDSFAMNYERGNRLLEFPRMQIQRYIPFNVGFWRQWKINVTL